jgi:hypothetical protein
MRPAKPSAARAKGELAPIGEMFCIDLRSLAACRIAVGLVVVWDLVQRSFDLRAHYTDAGVLPRAVLHSLYLSQRPYFSIHTLNGSAVYEAILFCIAGICALAMIAGYRTRWATIACWFLTCSLQARNPTILHGGDDLLRMLLFWGMFVPWGGQWSIDRARASRADTAAESVCSWGTAGLLLQVCFLYFFAGALKSHPSWRRDGTAVFLALSIDQFTTPIGKALLPYHAFLTVMTFGTLALELIGPFVAIFCFDISRVRTFIVASYIVFHIGLGMCIELGIFPMVCIAGWLAFLPGVFWDNVTRRYGPRWAALIARLPSHVTQCCSTWLTRVRAQPLRLQLSRAGSFFAGFCLIYIVLWNVRTINFARFSTVFPAQVNVIGEVLRIDQQWNLFAPYPSLEHGWYVLDAHLRDGEEVDLRTGRGVSWERPGLISATYVNERWRKYLMNLWSGQYAAYRPGYAKYLQRNWDESHPANRRLVKLDIYFVLETALPNYQASPAQHVMLYTESFSK